MGEIKLEDAIKIAQIISKAPEERLTLILSVLEKADFTVDGLAEIEAWRAFKEQACIIDLSEFKKRLFEKFPPKDGKAEIVPQEFNDFCKSIKLRPLLVKRLLAEKGVILTSDDKGKTTYSKTVWIDGKAQRRIVAVEA